MRVGFIGTGLMGNAMASLLVQAKHDVTVNDVRRDQSKNLTEMGAHWVDTPRAVAEASEVVFTSVPGPTEVKEIIFNPTTGLLTALKPGSYYIDCTTNLPSVSRYIADAIAKHGSQALDAPVTGRPPNMTMMIGGEQSAFDHCKPLFDIIGKNVFYVGNAGNGQVTKAVNQFLIFGGFILGAEALLLGAKAGVPVQAMYDVLAVGGGGNAVRLQEFPRTVFQRDFERKPTGPQTVDRWIKDASCAMEVSREFFAPSPMLKIAEDALQTAHAQGWSEEVWFAAVKVLEAITGAELRAEGSGH